VAKQQIPWLGSKFCRLQRTVVHTHYASLLLHEVTIDQNLTLELHQYFLRANNVGLSNDEIGRLKWCNLWGWLYNL